MEMLVDILSEFFEVAIHNILFNRRIYPDGIFVKRKKYGIPVRMSMHPQLNEYIANCLKSVRDKFLCDDINAFVVAFFDDRNSIVDRFVIEIGELKEATSHCEHNMKTLEAMLRSFCLKIAISTANLQPLRAGCHFKLFIHLRDTVQNNAPNISDPTKEIVWLETERGQSLIEKPILTPIVSADNSILKMQLFMENAQILPENEDPYNLSELESFLTF